MSSKRIIRSYSANGRYSSSANNEENEPPVQGESSRNYFLNVRPENRQTFCTIIAQITEETQPGFETTLKSHSVSENSDVKFTCIVTGHPAPEITWYKDDKEMDRYCGLPKYQIFHYGKKHSLQLYKCTEDDAAIYQASARNGKGIVSCSGVLEVGTMSEYKIHQRWFARLKQKADAKRRELEETRIRDKENIAHMANVQNRNLQRTLSPERAQRKRKSQVETNASSLNSLKNKEDGVKVHIPDPDAALNKNVEATWSVDRMEKPTASTPEVQNGYLTSPQETELVAVKEGKLPVNNSLEDLENGVFFNSGICEMEMLISAQPTDKEFAARKKKRKLSGDEGKLSLRKVEGNSQSTCDGTALNGIDQSRDSGILSRYLRDTLKRNKPHRDPQPSKSGDYMEIDEQVSSVMLGQRERTAMPSSPKSERTGKEKDLSCQSHKDAESEVTKFINDAKSIDQEAVFSSLQSPDRNLYFSVKDMYLETISGPGVHAQHQLPQVMEKNNEVDSQLQDHTTGQELLPSECADVPDLVGVKLENDAKQTKASEELQNMEISRTEIDITMPCVGLEMQNKNTFDNIQPSSEVKEDARSGEPVKGSTRFMDVSGKRAEEGFNSPLCPVDTILHTAFQGSCSSVTIQAVDKPKVPPPHGQEDPPEYPCLALPTQQLTCETLPESVELEEPAELDASLEEPAEPNASPVSERVGSECSVGAFSDEWEKLDIPSSSEHTDISVVHPTPVTLTSGETETELRDCHSESTLLPQSEEEAKPAMGNSNQTAQPVYQQDLDHTTDITAMEIVVPPVADDCQSIDVPQAAQEELVLVYKVPSEVKEATGQQVVAGSQPEGTSIDLALPFVEEVSTNVSVGDENVPEEMVAEIEGELLKVDCVREAGPKEEEQGDVSADGFGTNFVEKFLSYLKIPSFLLGEKSVTNVRKPESTSDISPVPELHAQNEDTSMLHKTRESTDASESPATGVELLLGTEVAHVIPASTEDHASDAPSGEADIDTAELNIRSLLPTVGEPKDTVITVPLLSKISPLSTVVPPSTLEDASTTVEFNIRSLLPTVDKPKMDTVTTVPPLSKISSLSAFPSTLEDDITTGVESSLYPPIVPEKSLEICTEPSKMEALKHPSFGVESCLSATLEVISFEGAEEKQGTTDKSKPDVTPHKCLIDAGEESNRVEEIIGDENKLLQVTSIPCNGTVPALKAPTPCTEGVISSNVQQATEVVSDVQVAEVDQVPSIVVDDVIFKSTVQEQIDDNEVTRTDAPAATLVQGSSAKIKLNDTLPIIPSATPAELASGARRKIFLPRSKQVDESEVLASDVLGLPTHPKKEEGVRKAHGEGEVGHVEEESSRFASTLKRNAALLQAPIVQQTMPQSPTTTRKMSTLEVPKLYEEPGDKVETGTDFTKSGVKTEDAKSTKNFLKAPQVIRKIRAEQFSDASGNLKLWCQFFNVLSDSTIRWDKDGLYLNKLKRSAGDESQVSLAIVQASAKDCGVYRCVVENEYGSDATDFLLSNEMLTGFISREEIEVGEEIEMTPMPITKGLTDTGFWGNKLFGRIMTKELYVGDGFRRKASRVKVIYGLEPIFESGATCIVKVRNFISYGTKHESGLIESNHDLTMQECKLQNTAREYSKIFAAEARAVNGFGPVPEVIPLHLLYRPANNIPYATIERDLIGPFMKYSMEDQGKNLVDESGSEIEQKCVTFQHWIYQWTNSNLLVMNLQGVGLKITGVQIATNSKGYQGLTGNCSSSVIEEFPDTHLCNRFCEALGLKSLKSTDTLKPKGPKSPSMTRRAQSGQSSPQIQRKGQSSPQTQRKGQSSPLVPRKGQTSPLVPRKGQTSPLVPRKGQSSPQPSRKNATSPNVVRKAGNAEDPQQTAKHKTVEIPKSDKLL